VYIFHTLQVKPRGSVQPFGLIFGPESSFFETGQERLSLAEGTYQSNNLLKIQLLQAEN